LFVGAQDYSLTLNHIHKGTQTKKLQVNIVDPELITLGAGNG